MFFTVNFQWQRTYRCPTFCLNRFQELKVYACSCIGVGEWLSNRLRKRGVRVTLLLLT